VGDYVRTSSGDERGAAVVPVLDDLQQVPALLIGEDPKAEVVEDDEIGLGDLGEQFAVTAVTAGGDDLTQESRGAQVADGEAL
jgi:hypothetical protein